MLPELYAAITYKTTDRAVVGHSMWKKKKKKKSAFIVKKKPKTKQPKR